MTYNCTTVNNRQIYLFSTDTNRVSFNLANFLGNNVDFIFKYLKSIVKSFSKPSSNDLMVAKEFLESHFPVFYINAQSIWVCAEHLNKETKESSIDEDLLKINFCFYSYYLLKYQTEKHVTDVNDYFMKYLIYFLIREQHYSIEQVSSSVLLWGKYYGELSKKVSSLEELNESMFLGVYVYSIKESSKEIYGDRLKNFTLITFQNYKNVAENFKGYLSSIIPVVQDTYLRYVNFMFKQTYHFDHFRDYHNMLLQQDLNYWETIKDKSIKIDKSA